MAIVNIYTRSDADFIRGFRYEYRLTGDPVDLTGYSLRMGVRKNAVDAIEFLLLTTENGSLIVTDPPDGRFTLWLTNKQLLRLPTESYVHSLIRIKDNMRLRIWNGALVHTAGPTRDGFVAPFGLRWNGEETYISRPDRGR